MFLGQCRIEVHFSREWGQDRCAVCHAIVGKNTFDVLGLVNENQSSCDVLADMDPKDPGSFSKDGGFESQAY